MGVQRINLFIIFALTLALGGLGISAVLMAKQDDREERLSEMAYNFRAALSDNKKKLVNVIDTILRQNSEMGVDQSWESSLQGLHFQSISYREEEDVPNSLRRGERVIYSTREVVGDHMYGLSYVMRQGAYAPSIRVDLLFANDQQIESFYFSTKAVFNVRMASDTVVVVYNEDVNAFASMYPHELRYRDDMIVSEAINVTRSLFDEALSSDISAYKVRKASGYDLVVIPSGVASGFVMAHRSEAWTTFAWLPSSRAWWIIFALTTLMGIVSAWVFNREIYRVTRISTLALQGRTSEVPELEARIRHGLLPVESSLLLREAKSVSFKAFGKPNQDMMHDFVDCYHEFGIIEMANRSLHKAQEPQTYTLHHFYFGDIEKARNHITEDDFGVVVEDTVKRLTSVFQDMSNAPDTSILVGYKDGGTFLVWFASSRGGYEAACSAMGNMYESRVGGIYIRRCNSTCLAIADSENLVNPARMNALLSTYLRMCRLDPLGFVDDVMLVDQATRLQIHSLMSLMDLAKSEISHTSVNIKYTPLTENGSGEIRMIIVEPFLVDGDVEHFIDVTKVGMWIHHDHTGHIAEKFVEELKLHATVLDKIGATNLKVVVKMGDAVWEHPPWASFLEMLTDEPFRERVIIEVGNAKLIEKSEEAVAYHNRGLRFACRQDTKSPMLLLPIPVEYFKASARFNIGNPVAYHTIQKSVRSAGLTLVNDLRSASEMYGISCFYNKRDLARLGGSESISVEEVVALIRSDIEENVRVPFAEADCPMENRLRESVETHDASDKTASNVYIGNFGAGGGG